MAQIHDTQARPALAWPNDDVRSVAGHSSGEQPPRTVRTIPRLAQLAHLFSRTAMVAYSSRQAIVSSGSVSMSPSRISSLATGAFVFVFLGLRGLAAAQVGLSEPGHWPKRAHRRETRLEPGKALVEKTCSPCRSVGVAGDSNNKKAPPFRGLYAQHPQFLAPRATCARHRCTPRGRNCASLSWRSRSTALWRLATAR